MCTPACIWNPAATTTVPLNMRGAWRANSPRKLGAADAATASAANTTNSVRLNMKCGMKRPLTVDCAVRGRDAVTVNTRAILTEVKSRALALVRSRT